MSKPYINTESINKILENQEYVSSAERFIKNIFNYASFIMREENLITIASTQAIDTQDYQDRITQIDNSRKIKHDSAISGLSSLNRIAKMMDIEEVYKGEIDYDPTTRGDIANCIIQWAKENLDKDKYGVVWNK